MHWDQRTGTGPSAHAGLPTHMRIRRVSGKSETYLRAQRWHEHSLVRNLCNERGVLEAHGKSCQSGCDARPKRRRVETHSDRWNRSKSLASLHVLWHLKLVKEELSWNSHCHSRRRCQAAKCQAWTDRTTKSPWYGAHVAGPDL